MKRNMKEATSAVLAAAALTGLLAGAVCAQTDSPTTLADSKGATKKAGKASVKKAAEKPSCKGKTSCKGKSSCKTKEGCSGKPAK